MYVSMRGEYVSEWIFPVTNASRGGIIHVLLGSLFTPLPSVLSFPLLGFWCWPDLVDRPVGGRHVNRHLPDSIASHHHTIIPNPCFKALLTVTVKD